MDLLCESTAEGEEYPPYWAELWLSGLELAYAVSGETLTGTSVLELGCGLGLPSIAAALVGAEVLATDRSDDAIDFTMVNARRNGAVIETAVCRWEEPDDLVARGPWDLVLASDVLYRQDDLLCLGELLPRLVDPTGEIWIADPQRPLTEEFLRDAAADWRSISTVDTRLPMVKIHRLCRPR